MSATVKVCKIVDLWLKSSHDYKLQNIPIANKFCVFVVSREFSEGKATKNILSILEVPNSYLDSTKC